MRAVAVVRFPARRGVGGACAAALQSWRWASEVKQKGRCGGNGRALRAWAQLGLLRALARARARSARAPERACSCTGFGCADQWGLEVCRLEREPRGATKVWCDSGGAAHVLERCEQGERGLEAKCVNFGAKCT